VPEVSETGPEVPEAGSGDAAEAGPLDAAEAAGPAAPDGDPVPPAIPRVLDRALPDPVNLEAMEQEAERLLDAGDPSATDRFLDIAAASLREGRISAALDACYQALSLDPDGAGPHLALVQLYDHEGWSVLANEKLDLLATLASLDDDAGAADRIATARAARR
jgi:hypothetical protein